MRAAPYLSLMFCGLWLGLAACSDEQPRPRHHQGGDCPTRQTPPDSTAPASGTTSERGVKPIYNGSVYQFVPLSITGQPVRLSQYRGRKLLIVNIASRCRYTPQLTDLELLYQQYGSRVVVLGFPCNQFGSQAPGTDSTLNSFCTQNYGVTFPLFHKIDVSGTYAAPLYRFLSSRERNGVVNTAPTWNFCKYLIDENGYVERFFPATVSPMDTAIVNAILR